MSKARVIAAVIIVFALAGCRTSEMSESDKVATQASAAPTVQVTEYPEPGERPCEGYETPEDMLAAMEAGKCDLPPGFVEGTAAETPVEVEADRKYEPEHEIDVTGASWASNGIKVKVTRIALGDPDLVCNDLDEFERPEFCTSGGQAVIALDVRVVNDSGKDVDAYTDQGELVVGSEQIPMAEWFVTDEIGGTFREGTKGEGQIWWISDQTTDEIHELGELRYIVPGPTWTDDWEPVDGTYDDIDLTVSW